MRSRRSPTALWLALACAGCGTQAAEPASSAAGSGGVSGAGSGVTGTAGTRASAGSAGANGPPGAGAGGATAAGASGGAGAGGTADDPGATAGAGAGGAGAGPDAAASSDALDALESYLAMPRAQRPELATQPFAEVALARDDAERAQTRLWDDFAQYVRDTRAAEVGATESQPASLEVGGSTLRYYMAVRGAAPASGRSLFISMHGGGNAPAATNDSQWDNQLALVEGYAPVDALWVAPRAPIDDWNMWFIDAIDPLFERLITDLIVFEGIDPNKVYITGYSAGGDGVYQLGPRMADHWAGAAMSAGHPNDASPLNLRNLAFAIHVGGDDTAYDRNLVAAQWGQMLEQLAAADGAGGYPNQWQVHAGLPHWMNLEDAVAIPFVQMHTRDPIPTKVVWRQANVTCSRFYWLAVDQAEEAQGTTVTAAYSGNAVTLEGVSGLANLTLRLSDAMMDLGQPVHVELDGRALYDGPVTRTIAVLSRTLEERGDPAMVFSAELAVPLE